MLISALISTIFYRIGIIILFITLLLCAILGTKKQTRLQENVGKVGSIVILCIFIIAFVGHWLFPNVYTVTNCGNFTKKILIIPTTLHQTKLGYGSHSYLVNESTHYLKVKTVLYGKFIEPISSEKMIDQTIGDQTVTEFSPLALDYFFTEPDQSVWHDTTWSQMPWNSELDPVAKYTIRCMD